MQKIAEGFILDDKRVIVDEISYIVNQPKSEVGIKIHSGRNRIVRRIFEHFDYNVKKLDRVIFAGLTKKNLPRGMYRHLTEMEVNTLKML
jgi:23S rRNA pseudouridine2605 synthase